MSGSQAPTMGEVLSAIERERAAWEEVLAEVGEGRMLEPGPMGAWTFKDLVAHLSAWRARTLQRLEAAANGQPEPAPVWPPALQTDDEINGWIYEANKDRLLGEVIDESRDSYARLAEIVHTLPAEALSDPAYFSWMQRQSLGEVISSGGLSGHFREEHEPQLRRWLADSH